MVDIEFVGQLVDSMHEAVLLLDKAVIDKDKERTHKLKIFIFDLHNQISNIIGGQNV